MSQIFCRYHSGPVGPSRSSFKSLLLLVLATVSCALISWECQKSDSGIIDSLGSPPIIVNASIQPSTVNLDAVAQIDASLQFTVEATITHPEGPSAIARVSYSLSDASGLEPLANGSIYDDGTSPDSHAGDGVFTAILKVSAQDLPVGTYYCQFVAQSTQGYSSNTLIIPLSVIRKTDNPPVLSDLQAPDTISIRGQTQMLVLAVKATDPDGQSDIAKVFFHSFKPNGTPTNGGAAFLMYDDGGEDSGDAVKGDSIYTLTVVVDPSNALGRYRFDFQATDRSNVSSSTLTHYIQIVE